MTSIASEMKVKLIAMLNLIWLGILDALSLDPSGLWFESQESMNLTNILKIVGDLG